MSRAETVREVLWLSDWFVWLGGWLCVWLAVCACPPVCLPLFRLCVCIGCLSACQLVCLRASLSVCVLVCPCVHVATYSPSETLAVPTVKRRCAC